MKKVSDEQGASIEMATRSTTGTISIGDNRILEREGGRRSRGGEKNVHSEVEWFG